MSAKKGYSPRSAPGVGFFNHFPRQRLRPYGEIKEATPDCNGRKSEHNQLRISIKTECRIKQTGRHGLIQQRHVTHYVNIS